MALAVYLLSAWACLLWIYFLWSRRRFYRVAWQLPGPIGLPLIGLGLSMRNPETFLPYMAKMSEKYNSPCVSWMGTNCFLYVNDPETVETVFNSPHCTNKGDFYRFMATALGDGLFTSSSPRWNKHRRLINPAFSRQVISNFLPIFNAEADVLLQKFAALCAGAGSGKCEIYALLKKSVLEAACQTTMGKKMNFQNDGSAAIFESYNGITEVCVRRMLSPWLYPDAIYRRTPLHTRQQKVVNVLFGFVENLLQHASNKSGVATSSPMASMLQSTSASPASSGRLGEVVEATEDTDATRTGGIRKSKAIFVEQVRSYVDQGQLSWEDVRDEANVIIAATFETTSTALYLVCLCLAMHPEYQDKLYNELLQLFPVNENNNNDDNDGADSFDVSHEQLERMSYTEMLINEAMRLFAPVPMVLRSASADFMLRSGVVVPRGTQIGIDIYNMQRSERVWGPQACSFRPEEHFGPQAEARRHPFAFVPFTKGLRMCIGYRYALMLMKVLLAKIFLNYRIRTEARMEQLIVKGTISLKLREYPLCEVIPR